MVLVFSGKPCLHPTAEQEEEQSCIGKTLQPEKTSVSNLYRQLVNNIKIIFMTDDFTLVLFILWSLQEASPEFEVVNMDGKTTDALTVCT